jgi:uncharacterized SAM-binding protein YcdF (DUF218 family)
MVVLGCAIQNVQQERVSTALNYASNLTQNDIVWFVTGGVKNAVTEMVSSEAEQMREKINGSKGKIILDDKARNTAENFAYLKKWMSETYKESDESPEIVITTSEFHQARAARIFNGIFQNDNSSPEWNLSKSDSCTYCWNDERIHMQNVGIDIKNALHILA